MKISNMTTKTALEIQDTDVLVIEDGEDTKQVTVAELRTYMLSSGISKTMKIMINETLDKVATALNTAKYIITQSQSYKVSVTINDDSGVIQLSLEDTETGTWLTQDGLNTLFTSDSHSVIEVNVDDILITPTAVEIISAEDATDIGIIKLQFTGLTHNNIASITYEDIYVTIPATEEYQYDFTIEPVLFTNNVPYVDDIG